MVRHAKLVPNRNSRSRSRCPRTEWQPFRRAHCAGLTEAYTSPLFRADRGLQLYACWPAMVNFFAKEQDEEEEKTIKLGAVKFSVPADNAEDGDDLDEGAGGGSMGEKSIMPGKRANPISAYLVVVRTLQGDELGPFTLGAVDKVADVKAKVAEAAGMKPEQQRLFFEIPSKSGSVGGGAGEINLAPGVPAMQIQGFQPDWPRVMQKRPLRKGRADQCLRSLQLGEGFDRADKPANSVAFTAWLVPRPAGAGAGKSDVELDHDDSDIEPKNLEVATGKGVLARRKSSQVTDSALQSAPSTRKACAIM